MVRQLALPDPPRRSDRTPPSCTAPSFHADAGRFAPSQPCPWERFEQNPEIRAEVLRAPASFGSALEGVQEALLRSKARFNPTTVYADRGVFDECLQWDG